ncbi:MAG: hypothetical protein HZC10_00330 [Nitrospirae bacterium]|nr:hypothetical protein [Nitrospirota bacterium]
MKQMILILLLLFLNVNPCYSKDNVTIVNNDKQILEKIQDDIKEIRRDQLNYRIEKDLLKETYSSNYTTVQIIISIVLAFFAILGYVGFKSIFGLKKEYDSELAKIKELKIDFEVKLKELTKSQEKVQNQISSIDTLNQEQNQKIKLLEIKEKIGSYYRQKGYQRALDYIAIGLEMAKDDIELLMFRAFSLAQLRNYVEAIETYKKILTIEPMDISAIQNLAELYLVAGQIENYDNIVRDKSEFFKSTPLLTYLEAFKFYLENKSTDLKNKISDFIEKQDVSINKNHLRAWDFTEFYDVLNSKSDSPEKTLLMNFANYLKGVMSGSEIKNLLKQ